MITIRKKWLLLFVPLLLLWSSVMVVQAVNPEWYLYPDLKLNSTPPSVTSYYSLNGLQEWVAEPTQSAVTINPGDWVLFLDYYIPCADCMGRLWIEVWNDSAKIADGNMFFGTGYHGTMSIYMRNGIRADFKEGERLRLKMKWVPVGYSGSIRLYCGASGSKLSGPPVNTNAPVPESSAFVLFASGLSVLSGYLGMHARKRKRDIK